MKISIIIPSRLAVNPMSESSALYLRRAIGSVRRQRMEPEIVVGLSPEHGDGAYIAVSETLGVRAIVAGRPGQAAAVNAAVAASTGDVLAFLEDDDHWSDNRLEYGLAALESGFDFVSSNQREVTVDGSFVRVNDFATPSGWMMTRDLWSRVGPMNEHSKWHLDNEWLGRLNESGAKRLHLIEVGADREPRREWLRNIMQFSKAATTEEREPLVTRTVNPDGGMSRIARDPVAKNESRTEHGALWERFGCIPW